MERDKAARLANLILAYRPGWNVREVTEEIAALTGASDGAIAHFVIGLVMDPETRWPQRIGLRWNPEEPVTENRSKPGNPEPCDICGRSEWSCRKAIANTGVGHHPYSPPSAMRGNREVQDVDLVSALEAASMIGRRLT